MLSNTVFSVFSFIGIILVLVQFPWHLEAWNTGTCLYMVWTAVGLLVFFVNSVLWKDNVTNWSPVYCDIATRIITGIAFAIPAATLSINYRLYKIASMNTVKISKREKLHTVMVDLAISFGLPILLMAIEYIPEGHRFDIYEEIGCLPENANTPVAVALVLCPPIIIGLISAFFSVRSIVLLRRTHTEFREALSLSSNCNLDSYRFYRLMALAAVNVIFTVPLGVVFLENDIRNHILPWVSWDDTHSHFSRVRQFPSIFWRMNPRSRVGLELSRWALVFCAFLFFSFFGFAQEARERYRRLFSSVVRRFGYTSSSGTTKIGSGMGSSTSSKFFRAGLFTSKRGKGSGFGLPKTGNIPSDLVSQNTHVEKNDSSADLDTISVSELSSIKEDIESSPGSSSSQHIPDSASTREIKIPPLDVLSSS